MKKKDSSLTQKLTFFPCFYCNVDSTELKIFVIVVIGGLVLSTTLAGLGLYLKGTFKNREGLNSLPLERENILPNKHNQKDHL